MSGRVGTVLTWVWLSDHVGVVQTGVWPFDHVEVGLPLAIFLLPWNTASSRVLGQARIDKEEGVWQGKGSRLRAEQDGRESWGVVRPWSLDEEGGGAC